MLAKQLKNYLEKIDDNVNILIYVAKTNDSRQLLFSDLDINQDGNVIIDAEYEPKVKETVLPSNYFRGVDK